MRLYNIQMGLLVLQTFSSLRFMGKFTGEHSLNSTNIHWPAEHCSVCQSPPSFRSFDLIYVPQPSATVWALGFVNNSMLSLFYQTRRNLLFCYPDDSRRSSHVHVPSLFYINNQSSQFKLSDKQRTPIQYGHRGSSGSRLRPWILVIFMATVLWLFAKTRRTAWHIYTY